VTIVVVPLVVQGVAMAVDEGVFHRRRGLPRWERIGHPLDTATLATCIIALCAGCSVATYAVLGALSTLFVTKDEGVHATRCSAGEHWLHAVLFALHPIVLAALWFASPTVRTVQLALVLAVMAYQIGYWNLRTARSIDNIWYKSLGVRWYEANDTPIALLRAEARQRNPWLAAAIAQAFGGPARVLDLGCGGGLLANELAARGHAVTGIDASTENLEVARAYDRTGRAVYTCGDARALPFAAGSFDVVCAMDLLEHVDDPAQIVAEAARVLAPGGLFFFHTFNRTWLASLVVVRGVELFVANTPRGLHVAKLFVKPDELATACSAHALDIVELHGSRPRFDRAMWRMLATGRVGDDFAFTFTRSTKIGYTGFARKS
jgi:2-polyprenyl-6-hydroxyphenyl methylase/3-demethylubiquinone-9 3-methyltransferase